MSFTQSIINQIGRDTGKVISNKIFKDAHSTPIKLVSEKSEKRAVKTEFEKTINFQIGARSTTLVNKLSGAQIVLRNEMNKFLSDGYLDIQETISLISMIELFNSKVSDVYDIIKLDEENNQNEILIIDKIVEQNANSFLTILNLSITGCEKFILNLKVKSFPKQMLINTFFAKNVATFIFCNIFSVSVMVIFGFPYLNLLGCLIGVCSYFYDLKKYRENLEIENKRIESFIELKNSIIDLLKK